ncbi:glycosyltransferase family 4 protein [Sulfurimonas sp. SAG-AH-194-L11]|nr:glycosyltransferase family 4 protein [Sulfurimonas sp. SAG-AH-194-L11]MDF1876647.1 glycosyltransferase family 4 protein [Sulfurimonas sp. SAG-AH-194-L11]
MKVCIIIDDSLPSSIKVAAKMIHELACELILQGHEVSVITPDTNVSFVSVEKLDGVTIYRFHSGEIKNVGKVKRALNETLLSWNAWKNTKDILKENPHDLIIYYSPTIFFGPFVYMLKRVWNVKSYLILRDFFPQWTIDNKILKKHSPITYYFKFFERINYSVADTIGVMSEKNLEWFRRYYKTDKPLEVLYNWADLQMFEKESDRYRKKLGLKNKVVFFYGGNLGHAQDMMNIVRLAVNMKYEKQAHFVLVGAGDEYELIEDNIQSQNITLLPSVNQEEFKQMLSEFDIGLFTLNKNHITHNFPGKLLGYMVQEMPILGSVNPDNDLKNVLEKYDAGLVTVNGEDQLFYENAKKLLDEKFRLQMGKNAKNLLIEKFSVGSAVVQIL